MKFLRKLQALPEKTRKVILWSVVIALAICLLAWWFNGLREKLTGFESGSFIEGLNLPEIEMPQIPEISEEKLEEFKKAIEENGQ